MDPEDKYLLSLGAVRDRAKLVGEAAEAGKLRNFDVHEESLSDVAEFVTSLIKVCRQIMSGNSKLRQADSTARSEISDPTNSTLFLLMADGSTLKSAMYLALPISSTNGEATDPMILRSLVASSISSSFPCFWTLVRAIIGDTWSQE